MKSRNCPPKGKDRLEKTLTFRVPLVATVYSGRVHQITTLRSASKSSICRWLQHSKKIPTYPGSTYPRPSISCLWRRSFHSSILGYLGYVDPGVNLKFSQRSIQPFGRWWFSPESSIPSWPHRHLAIHKSYPIVRCGPAQNWNLSTSWLEREPPKKISLKKRYSSSGVEDVGVGRPIYPSFHNHGSEK